MTLRKIDENMIDPNFVGKVNDHTAQLAEKASKAVYRESAGGMAGNNSLNMIQGHAGNGVASDLSSVLINGGGATGFENVVGGSTTNVGTPTSNVANLLGTGANYSVIGGGYDNVANGLASALTGFHCKIEKEATHGTISGGSYHQITAGDYGTIGGGTANKVHAGRGYIGGGQGNTINTAGTGGAILGGSNNTISADNGIIGGGNNNLSSGSASGIFTGTNNVASAQYSTIMGGTGNESSGYGATVAGGTTNKSIGATASVGGGTGNQATGTSSTVSGGQGSVASNTGATVVGGRDNLASGLYSTAIGRDAKATNEGQVAHADGKFAVQGDAQRSTMVLRRQTTNTTPTLIGLGGVASSPQMAADTTWGFKYTIVARRTDVDGESAYIEVKGLIQKGSTGSSTLVGTPTKTVIAASTGATTWDVAIFTGASSLQINAIGEASKTINWVAQLDLIEVTG